MQLNRYTDYGLRILMMVAAKPEGQGPTRIQDVCNVFDLSANHVRKLVHQLGQLGYLQTRRGARGGFELAQSPQEIGLGSVIRALESRIELVDCRQPPCRLAGGCRLKTALDDAMAAFWRVLDHYTLADVVSNRDFVRQRLDGLLAPVTTANRPHEDGCLE